MCYDADWSHRGKTGALETTQEPPNHSPKASPENREPVTSLCQHVDPVTNGNNKTIDGNMSKHKRDFPESFKCESGIEPEEEKQRARGCTAASNASLQDAEDETNKTTATTTQPQTKRGRQHNGSGNRAAPPPPRAAYSPSGSRDHLRNPKSRLHQKPNHHTLRLNLQDLAESTPPSGLLASRDDSRRTTRYRETDKAERVSQPR
ncbi:hypothetical protein Bca101_073176 [Brassica carinata]